jgi:hypothetical protein
MTRLFVIAALGTGLGAVGWIGWGYGPAHPLALATTLLIGGFFAIGAAELLRFRQATAALATSLAGLHDDLPQLGDWLDRLPPGLQPPVRQRIEGERAGLPGPVLTPYLVGLLVLLGMLGTFLGMVVTLNGTAGALEGSADVAAMRAALAAPVKGLGLAFGTSVAGVAASAMLGLASALARRERLVVGQALDRHIATTLRRFSLAQQRQEAYRALQLQSQAMPALVGQLNGLVNQLDRQSQALNERLLANQDSLQRSTEAAFLQLAASVDRTLQHTLTESARQAGAAIQPALQAALDGLGREATALHAHVNQTLTDTVQAQGAAMAQRLATAVAGIEQGLGQTVDALARQSRDLLAAQAEQGARQAAETQSVLAAQDQARLAEFRGTLQDMAAGLQQAWQQAGAQTLAQQQQICTTLERSAGEMAAQAEAHARRTIAEIAQLSQAATDAPRAAAELIGQMREQFSQSLARDQGLLDERARLMAGLDRLLQTLQQGAAAQGSAVEGLVAAADQALARAGQDFAAQLDATGQRFGAQLQDAAAAFAAQAQADGERIASAAAHASAGAAEIASLGEAFGQALQHFGDANAQLLAQLQQVESALGQAMARSDEQLAYYVAQAREIVDLSLGAQKQIVDDLQRLAPAPRAPVPARPGTAAPAEAGQPA